MREREERQKVLIGGFCTRRTRCNLERDKERESEGVETQEERDYARSLRAILLALPQCTGKGKDNVRNGVLTSSLRDTSL